LFQSNLRPLQSLLQLTSLPNDMFPCNCCTLIFFDWVSSLWDGLLKIEGEWAKVGSRTIEVDRCWIALTDLSGLLFCKKQIVLK